MAERLSVTLHELVSALDSYADAVLRDRYDTTFSEFQYLATLAEVGTVDMTALAQCLVITRAAVSKRVPALVAAGWIQTSRDPANARRVLLSLTPRAVDLVDRAGGELEASVHSLIDEPPPVDADLLHSSLRTLLARISERERPA